MQNIQIVRIWNNSILFHDTFSASFHDGLTMRRFASIDTRSNFFWNNSRQQSIIIMISCGGLANFFKVAISAGLMVCGSHRYEWFYST